MDYYSKQLEKQAPPLALRAVQRLQLQTRREARRAPGVEDARPLQHARRGADELLRESQGDVPWAGLALGARGRAWALPLAG